MPVVSLMRFHRSFGSSINTIVNTAFTPYWRGGSALPMPEAVTFTS